MTTVALATTRAAHELGTGLELRHLSALSALVTDRPAAAPTRLRGLSTAVHHADSAALSGPYVWFTDRMTTTSSRTLATEATMTPGARCMCRMCAF
ncbi:hypothetical protein SAURM35S_04596 [Streptomyces aurantiogriseus]